jgi:hypothetical protein
VQEDPGSYTQHMTDTATQQPATGSLPAPLLLLFGVILAPLLLGVVFNSYSAPDAAAYVRMAFASVAAIVIGIVTVLALLIDRIAHRAPRSEIVTFAVIALVVILWDAQSLGQVSERLITNLSLVG